MKPIELFPSFSSPLPAGVAFACTGPRGGPVGELLPQERALLGGGASQKRLGDFARGRACAHAALAELGFEDAGASPTPLLRAAGRAPQWPPGAVGSITHNQGGAAAAAARAEDYLGLGIDLERPGRLSEKMAVRICRPEEIARLEALNGKARAMAAALIFSAKESIFKALNPASGVYLGFRDAALETLPPAEAEEGAFRWRLHRACGADFPEGFTGPGRFLLRGGLLLTGVWLARAAPP